MTIRIIRERGALIDFTLFIGPFAGRLCLSRHGSFAYQGDVINRPVLRFVRRFWSGWFRWADQPDF